MPQWDLGNLGQTEEPLKEDFGGITPQSRILTRAFCCTGFFFSVSFHSLLSHDCTDGTVADITLYCISPSSSSYIPSKCTQELRAHSLIHTRMDTEQFGQWCLLFLLSPLQTKHSCVHTEDRGKEGRMDREERRRDSRKRWLRNRDMSSWALFGG